MADALVGMPHKAFHIAYVSFSNKHAFPIDAIVILFFEECVGYSF